MRSFLNFLIFAVAVCTSVTAAAQDDRLAATWQVKKYDIGVSLPPSESVREIPIVATLEVVNVSGRPATSLTLRLSPDATVTAVKLGAEMIDHSKRSERVGSGTLQLVALRLPSIAPNASLTATVEYKLKVDDNSGLRSITPLGVQMLPLGFWYPTPNSWYFSRGADFAPFRIKVDGRQQTTVSSGTMSAGAFENSFYGQPFFVSGTWDRIESNGVEVYVPPGLGQEAAARANEAADVAVEAKAFAESVLGKAPAVPIRIVAVRRGAGFANSGTILVDDGSFRRQKLDALTTATIAESVVKMWLGGSVRVTDDGAGVIREGLSRHIATKFIEQKFGSDIAEVERMRQRTAYAAVSRRDAPLRTVAPLDDYYFSAVANKGAMFWRLLERRLGQDEFYSAVRSELGSGTLRLAEFRKAFPTQANFVNYMLDEVTDINLLVGLPQRSGGESKVALRNTGGTDVTVNVVATLANGQTMSSPVTLRATSFGEVSFRSPETIVRIEVDPEKIYPQSDYSDDVAPRETTDSDLLLAVKRDFDRQEFAAAEKTAVNVLRTYPRFDDVRVLLARSLLAQNKLSEAERQFRLVLEEKLPAARSIAWAHVGLADLGMKTGRSSEVGPNVTAAIMAEAEYGASLAARNIRSSANLPSQVDDSIKDFFVRFDRAAVSNRKAELEAFAVSGEVDRFVSGISGQTTKWTTQPVYVDTLDANTVLVETRLDVQLLTRNPESGMAVYRLIRTGQGWKLAGLEIFEVR